MKMAADIMCVQTLLKGRYGKHTNYSLRALRQTTKGRSLDLQQVDGQALLLLRSLPEAEATC